MNLNKKIFIPLGNFFFKYRDIIFTSVYLVPLAISPPKAYGQADLFYLRITIAVLLAFGGQAYRFLVIGYRYIKRGGKNKEIYADDLVVEGFFAHSRNPLYLGNLMIITGLCLMYGTSSACFIALPFFYIGYYSLIVAEEEYLRGRFGKQYEDYEKSVSRFVPDLRGIKKSLIGYQFDWKRAVRKDYGNMFFVCLGILIIATYSRFQAHGEEAIKTGLMWGIMLGLAYLTAWTLKKTGCLKSDKKTTDRKTAHI